jgi:hypothetical protein
MSVGTPKGGITAPAVFVHDFAELDKLADADVKGKVVVFNPGWHGYGVGSIPVRCAMTRNSPRCLRRPSALRTRC